MDSFLIFDTGGNFKIYYISIIWKCFILLRLTEYIVCDIGIVKENMSESV